MLPKSFRSSRRSFPPTIPVRGNLRKELLSVSLPGFTAHVTPNRGVNLRTTFEVAGSALARTSKITPQQFTIQNGCQGESEAYTCHKYQVGCWLEDCYTLGIFKRQRAVIQYNWCCCGPDNAPCQDRGTASIVRR